MYNVRTNVLITSDMNQKLAKIAKRKGVSKGEIIREAIMKSDILKDAPNKPDESLKEDTELKEFIKSGWKLLKTPEKPLNYKELIEDGRTE